MTLLNAFFRRWRAWRRALRFIALYSTNMTVRRELVIVIRVEDADRLELDDLKIALPGWHVAWTNDNEVRCVPPAVAPQRRKT
jgi:hypothetical protein